VAVGLFAAASPALAQTTITNTPPWNGIDGTGFGYPPYGVQTSGQTVTVPAAPDTTLESFTVNLQVPTSLVFRGEVYAWDSTLGHATGSALYESPPTKTTANQYQAITFNPDVNLTTSATGQYVLFVSVSRDYNAASQDVGNIGATVSDSYPGGGYFYMQNAGHTDQWTTTKWYSCSYCGTADLAFTATFGPPDSDLALAQPSNVTVDATSPAGAVVTLNPAVTDESLSTVTVGCLPASGSTFAIGDTSVTCTATDTDGDTNSPVVSQPFNVHVKGAAEQLADLATDVQGVGPGQSLANLVASAQSLLAANHVHGACGTLNDFIGLSTAQGLSTFAAAEQQIQAVIPCTS
jgi:hypothetical protein